MADLTAATQARATTHPLKLKKAIPSSFEPANLDKNGVSLPAPNFREVAGDVAEPPPTSTSEGQPETQSFKPQRGKKQRNGYENDSGSDSDDKDPRYNKGHVDNSAVRRRTKKPVKGQPTDLVRVGEVPTPMSLTPEETAHETLGGPCTAFDATKESDLLEDLIRRAEEELILRRGRLNEFSKRPSHSNTSKLLGIIQDLHDALANIPRSSNWYERGSHLHLVNSRFRGDCIITLSTFSAILESKILGDLKERVMLGPDAGPSISEAMGLAPCETPEQCQQDESIPPQYVDWAFQQEVDLTGPLSLILIKGGNPASIKKVSWGDADRLGWSQINAFNPSQPEATPRWFRYEYDEIRGHAFKIAIDGEVLGLWTSSGDIAWEERSIEHKYRQPTSWSSLG
ncbi:Uu.00g084760.m01.CDS01 [Anthostomella pinea]|uniref:Uu.00g084760.m01.CDS01 n=1 Tax=Anthostomella pinea TaxID=933095 RepID=A0AAI8YJQ7_9PEZI|nr:Uu.00g084760.m01.CDS01 [Anthostomella pinea]